MTTIERPQGRAAPSLTQGPRRGPFVALGVKSSWDGPATTWERIAGLDPALAAARLRDEGPNELGLSQRRTLRDIAGEVLREPMFGLLLGAGAIYLAMGDAREALILLGFVFIIMGITVLQERRTDKALDALRDLSSPRALVMRGGQALRIPGRDVVREDVLLLAEGDRVPADGVLLQAHELATDESMLTGESEAVGHLIVGSHESVAIRAQISSVTPLTAQILRMPDHQPARRHVLALAAATAVPLWLLRSAWSKPHLDANPFALGVASGSPGHDSVVLWTRLVHTALANAGKVTVRWELAQDEAFKQIVLKGQAEALPELAHSVHVEAAGLDSARSYFYRFMTASAGDSWVSTVGMTRTLPEPDAPVKRLRLAYASCQRFEHGYFTAWRHLVADKPDVVLFQGDYIYEYASASDAVRRHHDGWAHDLASYRQRYALHKLDADLQAAHAFCPWFFIWDDHEVQNEYAGLSAGDGGPAVADFAARRAAAYQAWYEHMPVRASVLTQALEGLALGAPMRIHGGARFGRLASMALLDTRQYRDARVCTQGNPAGSSTVDPASCESWMDPKRSLLGMAQEKWLTKHLSRHAGSAMWNLIAQTTIFGQRDFRTGPGKSLWNDAWDGYAGARKRLTDALASNQVGNAVLLGGDVHQNWVGHVKADYANPRSAAVGVEFCGTSITSRSVGNAKIAQYLAENPHFIYAEGERKGYGIAEFTPKRMTVALRVVDDVTLQDTKIETLAQFAVQAGHAKVEVA